MRARAAPARLDGAAAIAPANAVAFVAASTDLGSSEWHGVGKQFMTKFKSLAPALGGELDVAVLPSKAIVGFTQPQDSAKLDRAREEARRADACDRRLDRDRKDERSPGHRCERDVASRGQQSVHRGDEPAAERRARARVRERAGGADVARVDSGHSTFQALRVEGRHGTSSRFVGRGRTHEHERRLEARGVHRTGGSPAAPGTSSPTPPYASALVDEIPSGALAVVDFQVTSGMFENLGTLPAPL